MKTGHMDRQMNRKSDGQTDRQAGRQTDEWMDNRQQTDELKTER